MTRSPLEGGLLATGDVPVELSWDGRDNLGNEAGPGVHPYELRSSIGATSGTVVLME